MTVNSACYIGQQRKLRQFAIDLYGVDKVALMSTNELCKELAQDGYQTYCVCHGEYDDKEYMFIAKSEDVDKLISSNGEWLTR